MSFWSIMRTVPFTSQSLEHVSSLDTFPNAIAVYFLNAVLGHIPLVVDCRWGRGVLGGQSGDLLFVEWVKDGV